MFSLVGLTFLCAFSLPPVVAGKSFAAHDRYFEWRDKLAGDPRGPKVDITAHAPGGYSSKTT
jgi:hypothetical protein